MSEERVSEMVERIARALHDLAYGTEEGWEDWIPEARTALDAMREPTDAMMIAAADSFGKRRMHVGHSGSDQVAGAITAYSAMINAALSPAGRAALSQGEETDA